jgi:hypothetical protein
VRKDGDQSAERRWTPQRSSERPFAGLQSAEYRWIKRDSDTGRFMDQMAKPEKPFKGVRKEK